MLEGFFDCSQRYIFDLQTETIHTKIYHLNLELDLRCHRADQSDSDASNIAMDSEGKSAHCLFVITASTEGCRTVEVVS